MEDADGLTLDERSATLARYRRRGRHDQRHDEQSDDDAGEDEQAALQKRRVLVLAVSGRSHGNVF